MTISLADQPRPTPPLHEVEADWKREQWPGYAPPFVMEHCLCGGLIRARNVWPEIAIAVHAHNQSTRHEQWAIENGWRHG